jgi:hypothetical protein
MRQRYGPTSILMSGSISSGVEYTRPPRRSLASNTQIWSHVYASLSMQRRYAKYAPPQPPPTTATVQWSSWASSARAPPKEIRVPTAEASARVFIMFGDSWVSFWNGSTAIHWRAHSHAVAYMPTCAYGSTAYSLKAVQP